MAWRARVPSAVRSARVRIAPRRVAAGSEGLATSSVDAAGASTAERTTEGVKDSSVPSSVCRTRPSDGTGESGEAGVDGAAPRLTLRDRDEEMEETCVV